MELFSVLVTGANRGIGLEFVKQLVHATKPPKHVFATYRNVDATKRAWSHSAYLLLLQIGLEFVKKLVHATKPPKHVFATYRNVDTIKELEAIQQSAPPDLQVHLVKFDVTSNEDLNNLKELVENTVGEKGLTLLINNAGIAKCGPYPNVTAENLNIHFQVNTVGPVLVAQAFLPLLRKAASLQSSNNGMRFSRAVILNMSSMVGSITNTGAQFTCDLVVPSYKMSKAALNMAMRVMAAAQKNNNVLIVNMCPGWVKTDMGSKCGDISPEESISTMLSTISKLNDTHHGAYVDRFGTPIPW